MKLIKANADGNSGNIILNSKTILVQIYFPALIPLITVDTAVRIR